MERMEREGPAKGSPMPDLEVAALARVDLEVVAIMISARLDDGDLEARRLALLDAATRAGREAGRRLEVLSRHALSESRGSHSTWNVASDAKSCFAALIDYCAAVRRASDQLGALAAECAAREEDGAPAEPERPEPVRLRVV